MLTPLQIDIMDFIKREDFHASLEDFLKQHPYIARNDAMDALSGLKSMRIVCVGPDLLNDFIGATNMGWKKMGWN